MALLRYMSWGATLLNALQMETDYESRHKLLDPNWQHGPISEPGSPNLFVDKVQTSDGSVSWIPSRRSRLSLPSPCYGQ